MLKTGDAVPNISLPNQKGEIISLADFIGKKAVVVFFYPKNNTRICTAEVCSFRDSYEDFLDLGAEVIGISHDSIESHQKFSSKQGLPFMLLSDPQRKAMKAFGVPSRLFGLLTQRITFVINIHGAIVHTFQSELFAQKHVNEALAMLQKRV